MNYFIYIVTNKANSVLYTGVTNNLERRIYEHANGLCDGFTKKYNCRKLVYFEQTENVVSAIEREKQIKGLLRAKKVAMIERDNPNWTEIALR
jgi:putative endonuclease